MQPRTNAFVFERVESSRGQLSFSEFSQQNQSLVVLFLTENDRRPALYGSLENIFQILLLFFDFTHHIVDSRFMEFDEMKEKIALNRA